MRISRSILAVAGAVACLLMAPGQARAGTPPPGSCHEISRPVALAAGQSADQMLRGTLCLPAVWAPGNHQVDVLVHGATYNRTYWASHPASTRLTIDANAFALHQLLGWVREQGFGQVNLVGHSMGSLVALNETSEYDDVDRLVLTGSLHPASPAGVALFAASAYTASEDPKFAGAGLDPGYFTTRPGTRQQRITVPLLLIVGQQDLFFCDSDQSVSCEQSDLAGREVAYYPNAASLTMWSVPGTGHDLALDATADVSFALINHWIWRH